LESEVVQLEPLAVKRGTAAKLLDVCYTTAYELCRAGELEVVQVGKEDRILLSSIKSYLERHRLSREQLVDRAKATAAARASAKLLKAA